MADSLQNIPKSRSMQANRHAAITPADDTPLDPAPSALYVVTSGDLVLKDAAGTEITYPVSAGQPFPLQGEGWSVQAATDAVVVMWFFVD